ncbi:choice-of-anchor D domain-containing protein [Tenacibaculum caenipelagi]|uniref:ASPM-SPD-2-Hydin domain-containing protein n=1 Tax=Tenacibaculum caenipelagi TaxID=1325435 RepID=A0A4R6TDX2_9FLAO|nr:choice-of-anchor D domain-containing protein [Tenacibaculum caenipelagi]TDQ24031.1 ASPM-SPD-2-Hydin domain-containing protein [Tenacibaculum caenipelagi]
MNIKNIVYALVAILILSCSKDDEPQLSPAKFSINQTSIDFGEVEIPTSKEIKLTVTNSGEEDLILKSYTFSGSNSAEFTVEASETEEIVLAGKTYEFSVVFKPTEEGDKTAVLTINSNVGEHKVDVSGKGAPEPVAVFSINPESKDFGDVMLGNEAILNFTISNTGNADLVISETTLGGTNADAYTTTNNSVTIPQNGATGVKVTFAPQTTGSKTATLSIVTNVGTYTVNLEGNGIPNPNAIVNIPDANFKASLLAHGTTITGDDFSKIDTNDDGEIQVKEAEAYYGSINCHERNISDLTGIEAFVNLQILYVGKNQLTSLDLSQNVALTKLYCFENQLTGLDISQNVALMILGCYDNQLTSLDVSKNVALIGLHCSNNQITSLDVSQNVALTELNCFENQLTGLDVSKNVALKGLYCSNNQITSLDVSQNVALTELNCFENQLTGLDISQNDALHFLGCSGNQITSLDVSQNVALTELNCFENQLTGLDVSKNVALTRLYCFSNQLTSLNLANGYNNKITYMKAQDNINLDCIQIDEGFTPPSNDYYWKKDDTASYSNGCF